MSILEVADAARDFLAGGRKKTVLFCVLLIFMTLCALGVLVDANSSRKDGRKREAQRELVLEQPLLSPNAPSVPDGYALSRETPEKWDDSEIERWFTFPDARDLEQLGASNDKVVSEIIGAAP